MTEANLCSRSNCSYTQCDSQTNDFCLHKSKEHFAPAMFYETVRDKVRYSVKKSTQHAARAAGIHACSDHTRMSVW